MEKEQLEEGRFKFLKKIILILIGMFLLILILSYFLLGDLFYVFEGRGSSFEIENFIVEFKNGKIIFKENVYNDLKSIYFYNQEKEIKVCLIGEKTDNYYISDFYIPEIISNDFRSVVSEECDERSLISLHTHPYKRCLFSDQDIKNYESFKKINKDGIIGIMCEKRRFSFYGG